MSLFTLILLMTCWEWAYILSSVFVSCIVAGGAVGVGYHRTTEQLARSSEVVSWYDGPDGISDKPGTPYGTNVKLIGIGFTSRP